jgi:hypothetical protein
VPVSAPAHIEARITVHIATSTVNTARYSALSIKVLIDVNHFMKQKSDCNEQTHTHT